MKRLDRVYPMTVLEQMTSLPRLGFQQLADRDAVQAWADLLAERLSRLDESRVSYEVGLREDDERRLAYTVIWVVNHGVRRGYVLDRGFLASTDYGTLASFGEHVAGLMAEGGVVKKGEKLEAVTSLAEALEWLQTEALRGQSRQRYKGLGEMNPDQLWETTLDAEARTLLQVRVEHADDAEDLFSTLMGDLVEPRRAFIQKNALNVANLDV